jgi:hypothetical protein
VLEERTLLGLRCRLLRARFSLEFRGPAIGILQLGMPTDPNFSGVWQLNVEKSVVRGEAPMKTFMKIDHAKSKIIQRVLVTHRDGTEAFVVFNYDTGDETINGIGTETVRSRAHWEGPELVIESWLKSKDRELRLVDYWSISSDGKTLTMAHRDDALAGQISVLDPAPLEAAANFGTRDK